MYKTKSQRRQKNYWDTLVKEVMQKGNPVKKKEKLQKTDYLIQNEQRAKKYILGEPLTSVYLTQREAECVFYLLQGKTMHETGLSLSLSPRTVEYYLGKIKQKLNCRKKKEVIRLISQTDFAKNLKSSLILKKSDEVD